MNKKFYIEIENIFTQNRLSVYRQDGCDDETALSRYLFNIAVCKSLYSTLHIFEIVLRNSIDKTLINFSKVQNWYDVLPLNATSQLKIDEAKRKITKKGKAITHDRIISELTLGFWTAFLTKTYSQCAFQSYIIKNCFKAVPKKQRNIANLQVIFDKMRILRNRVSHYERLIHWKDLKSQHDQLLNCINWLSASAFDMALKIDDFDSVYNAGTKPFEKIIQKNWN